MDKKSIGKKALSVCLAAALAASLSAASFAAGLSSSETDGTYSSSTAGENAVLVNGKTVTLTNPTVVKTGDSSAADADFYGVNAAVLAENKAALTIIGGSVTTGAAHANAVFSCGSGTTVNISGTVIKTSGNNSGGIMTTGGATTNADDLTVTTSGNSSAAIRSDRGGGDVNVSGGTYSTSGVGSPAIYSTADIDAENAYLTSSASEAVVIEGGNSVSLTGCTVVGDNTTANGQATNLQNVFIYQSTSGDAASGTGVFTMSGGSLTALSGDMFYVTNTVCTINLTGVALTCADGDLLDARADAWGSSGKNGGSVTLNAAAQTLAGDINIDGISALNLVLSDGSAYSGAINKGGEAGGVYVCVPSGCTWTLTADSYITSLECAAGAINLNGHTLYVNGAAYSAGAAASGSAVSAAAGGASGSGAQNGANSANAQAPANGQAPNAQGQQAPQTNGTLSKYIDKAIMLGILGQPKGSGAAAPAVSQSDGQPSGGQPSDIQQNAQSGLGGRLFDTISGLFGGNSAPADAVSSATALPADGSVTAENAAPAAGECTFSTGDIIRIAAVLNDLANGGSLSDFDLDSDDCAQYVDYAVEKCIIDDGEYTDMSASISVDNALAILTAAVSEDELDSIRTAAPAQQPAQNSAQSGIQQPAQNSTQSGTQQPAQSSTQSGTQQPAQNSAQSGTQQPAQNSTQSGTRQPVQNAQQPAQNVSAQAMNAGRFSGMAGRAV